MEAYVLENTDITLTVHDEGACVGQQCAIHNKTRHNMRGFKQWWRSDRKILERLNPFGGACPDPDQKEYWDITLKDSAWVEWIHGCVVNPYSGTGMCQSWEIDGVEAAWIDEKYAVTKDGRVWSFLRNSGPHNGNVRYLDYSHKPRLLSENDNGHGYSVVRLGTAKLWYVHRLVLTAWSGQCPDDMQCRHLDGDRSNNNLDNLEWGTSSANNMDKRSHGTMIIGEDHKRSKLTDEVVSEARMLWSSGMKLDEIKSQLELSVGRTTLHKALIGDTWRSVVPAGGKRKPVSESEIVRSWSAVN